MDYFIQIGKLLSLEVVKHWLARQMCYAVASARRNGIL